MASLGGVVAALVFLAHLCAASRLDTRIPRACTPEEATWNANQFLSKFQRRSSAYVKDWSRCTRPWWMDVMAQGSPEGSKVLFDIGCNKGYTSFYMFAVFAPHLRVTTKNIPEAMKAIGLEPSCGTCRDCEEKTDDLGPALMPSPQYNIQVHAFEPSSVSFGRLQKMKAVLLKNEAEVNGTRRRVDWVLHNAAVADKPGTAKFPTTCATTKCSLAQGSSSTTEVKVTTVDQVMFERGLNHIDILKVDAEGYDPAVLRGAARALREHRVSLLMFEYNNVGLWIKGDTLKGVVEYLGNYGYACWLEGDNLSRLTGCWHDSLEFQSWSNVVCAWRKAPVYKVLAKRSFKQPSTAATRRRGLRD